MTPANGRGQRPHLATLQIVAVAHDWDGQMVYGLGHGAHTQRQAFDPHPMDIAWLVWAASLGLLLGFMAGAIVILATLGSGILTRTREAAVARQAVAAARAADAQISSQALDAEFRAWWSEQGIPGIIEPQAVQLMTAWARHLLSRGAQ